MGRAVSLWHTWPARGWPADADEEHRFVADLADCAGTGPGDTGAPVDRDDVTLVLTALRCGITVEALLAFAPGIDPGRLLTAYRHLDRLRASAATAWERICAAGTGDAVTAHGPVAELVLPSPVRRLVAVADDPTQLAVALAAEQHQVGYVRSVAWLAEAQLGRVPGQEQAVGRLLLNPVDPGWWDHPQYLPRRVADITPNRARGLLGER